MIHSRERLQSIVEELPGSPLPVLTETERHLLRSLRTQGERAIRGRIVTRHAFEARRRPHGTDLVMEIEGRHAMAVAQQLAKRFSLVEDVGSAEVTRTDRGAILSLRPREEA